MAAALQNVPSSFFMFCFGDFEKKLSIPRAFALAYRDFLRQVSLEIETDDGRYWDVGIKEINGDFFIVDGWSDFVKDSQLLEMKLLVFRIVGPSTLHVTIFGHGSCFELPPPPSSFSSPNNEALAMWTWRFAKKLKEYNFTDQRLDIPLRFATGTGITNNPYLKLEDVHRRQWSIFVTDRNKRRMYSMTCGWIDFLRGNDLKAGAILLFQFVPDSDNVVKVLVMGEEEGKKLLSNAKQGGLLT